MSAAAFGWRYGLRGLAPSEQTVPALLIAQAARWGERAVVRTPGRQVSFAELPGLVGRRAAMLRAAGVARGDRVAALCSNRWELLELLLACGWIGATSVPLNTAARGPALEHMLANCGARLLLVEPELAPALERLAPGRLALERVWTTEPLAGRAAGCDLEPYPLAADAPAAPADVGPGETLAILYTSGTTGPSKGVCCPHAQLYWFGLNVAELLEITERDVLYTCLPLFHTNAINCFFQALVTGADYYLDTRFSASRFFARLSESGATVTYLLGAMVPILLKQPDAPEQRGHRVRVANGAAPPRAVDRAMRERFGFGIAECYASTETSCVLGAPLDEQRLGSMGRALPGFEAQVVDALDDACPDGQPGELVVRNREPFAIATGYFGMPEKTVEAWRNLWFHTGDRVVRDPDGRFRYLDRLTDSIRRRGENISSYEVEQVLMSHPAVAAAAAYAVPSELGEDEVMATLVLRDGHDADPVAIVRHCEPQLAYFAVPRFLAFADELPLTENGKVRKFVLRERGVVAGAWDREAAGCQLRRPSR